MLFSFLLFIDNILPNLKSETNMNHLHWKWSYLKMKLNVLSYERDLTDVTLDGV